MNIRVRTMAVSARRIELGARWLISTVLYLVVTTTLVGCSDGRPTRVAVSGTVLIDGQPLTRGIIQFVPEGTRPAAGKIDEQGRFTLTSYDGGDGVVLGTHRVMVAAKEMVGESKAKWLAPPKYADFRKSGLTVEVTEPTDDLTIELSWDGGKPFVK